MAGFALAVMTAPNNLATAPPAVCTAESPPGDLAASFGYDDLTKIQFIRAFDALPAMPVDALSAPYREATTYRLEADGYRLREEGFQTLRAVGSDLLIRPGWPIVL